MLTARVWTDARPSRQGPAACRSIRCVAKKEKMRRMRIGTTDDLTKGDVFWDVREASGPSRVEPARPSLRVVQDAYICIYRPGMRACSACRQDVDADGGVDSYGYAVKCSFFCVVVPMHRKSRVLLQIGRVRLPNNAPSRSGRGRMPLLVADHLGAAVAVVKIVGDADHAGGANVVGGCGLDGAGAAHAAQDLDRGDGRVCCFHGEACGRGGRGGVGVGGG